MATLNEQIVNYLQANPGYSDTQIAADMDKYGVTMEQMAAATGSTAADVQKRYDTQKAINAYGAANKDLAETDWANQMAKAGWTDLDISRATGVPLKEVEARHQRANTTNELTGLKSQLSTVQGNYTGLQGQLASLQKAYDDLSKKPITPTSTPTLTPTPTGVTPTPTGVTPQEAAPAGTTGVVYGPDGVMYSSAAAAIAAGVKNYTTTKPTGLVTTNNNLSGGFVAPTTTQTGNINPGGLISGAATQLFQNPVTVQGPSAKTVNPFALTR
jgi:hypothetical protein